MNGGRPNNPQNRGYNPGQQGQYPNLSNNFETVKNIIANLKEDYDTLNKQADIIANALNLNSSKLRKFYNHVKKIDILGVNDPNEVEKILKRELNKFIVVMFYDVGRESGNRELEEFSKGMKEIVEAVKSKQAKDIQKAFELFTDFFEAVVAFHKYYHPKS